MPCVSSWLALDGPHRDGWRGSFRGYFRRDRDARARQFMTQMSLRHRKLMQCKSLTDHLAVGGEHARPSRRAAPPAMQRTLSKRTPLTAAQRSEIARKAVPAHGSRIGGRPPIEALGPCPQLF